MNNKEPVTIQLASYANKLGYWMDFPDHREFYPATEPAKTLRRILVLLDKGYSVALEPNPGFAATSLMDELLKDTQVALRNALQAIDSFAPPQGPRAIQGSQAPQDDDDTVDILVDAVDYIGNRPEEFSSSICRGDIERLCNPCAARKHIVAAIKEQMEEEPHYFEGMSQQDRAWFVWEAYRDYENSCS